MVPLKMRIGIFNQAIHLHPLLRVNPLLSLQRCLLPLCRVGQEKSAFRLPAKIIDSYLTKSKVSFQDIVLCGKDDLLNDSLPDLAALVNPISVKFAS
jgi:hypothetical protein